MQVLLPYQFRYIQPSRGCSHPFNKPMDKSLDLSLMKKMSDFISNNKDQSLRKTINNQTYLIEISQVKDQLFLISYVTLDDT